MAVGYSPKLPLQPDQNDGFYMLNKTFGEVAKQNLKMIVLTVPGERIMEPNFGVGARNFLFNTDQSAYQNLHIKIVEQVRKYLPFVQIIDISMTNLSESSSRDIDSTQMGLQIIYTIPDLNLNDSLEMTFTNSQ